LYAMSCACPIISTPIPQAKELLTSDTGLIIDFNDSGQLSAGVCMLLNNDGLRLRFVQCVHRCLRFGKILLFRMVIYLRSY
jgi:glycosyltransferase involved in cell wall biosynthesis